MKDLVDQAIAQLGDDGRRLNLGNASWPPKLKRHFRKKAAQSLRIPLRSAHRFSVTEDMTVASKLELAFTTKQISYLAHTSCASFVEEQPGRFEIHDVSENEHLMGSGFLHWLENDSYLSAIAMQQACVARGFHASILIDDADDEKNEWVVWTDDHLDMK